MKKLEINNFSELFKALSDSKRLKMLAQICNCTKRGAISNVGELSSCCDVDLSVVSRHLNKLKTAGVLRAQKEGKEVYYKLNGKEVATQLRKLADFLESSCDSDSGKGG